MMKTKELKMRKCASFINLFLINILLEIVNAKTEKVKQNIVC